MQRLVTSWNIEYLSVVQVIHDSMCEEQRNFMVTTQYVSSLLLGGNMKILLMDQIEAVWDV